MIINITIEKEVAIKELIDITKFVNDGRHRGSDIYLASLRMKELSAKYDITHGDVIAFKEGK